MSQKLEAELFLPSDFAPTPTLHFPGGDVPMPESGLPSEITREYAREQGINLSDHECGCEFCLRSSALCPATQSSIAQEILGRKLAAGTTREPELIRNVLVEVMSKLDALVDFTDSDGEWKDRVRLARRELGRANVAATREPFEPVPARRRHLGQL